MKALKTLFVLLAVLISSHSFSQVIDGLPLDENGHINYNEVVKVDSVKANELYLRGKAFFVDVFKSGKDVMQMDDKDAGVVIGKGWNDITIKSIGMGVTVQMWYTIKIAAKDGRYKYEVYDITFKSYPSQYLPNGNTTPSEQMFDKKAYFKNNGKPRDISESYKTQMESSIQNTILLIKNSMTKPVSGSGGSKKDDW